MNKFYLILALFFFAFSSNAQEHKIVLGSKTKAYIMVNGAKTDSVAISSYNRQNRFVKILKGRLYTIEYITPANDDPHHLINAYSVVNDKFSLTESVPVYKEACVPDNLKIRLRKKGIKISYPKKLLKRYKDIITYEQFAHTATYVIKCK